MKEKHLNFSQEDELHGNIQNVTFAKKHGSLVDSGFRDRSHLKYYMYVCIYVCMSCICKNRNNTHM